MVEVFKAYKDWIKDKHGKTTNPLSKDKFKLEVNKNDQTYNKMIQVIDNPQRGKINKNGHKLFGSKANGWWGWKWNREDDSSMKI